MKTEADQGAAKALRTDLASKAARGLAAVSLKDHVKQMGKAGYKALPGYLGVRMGCRIMTIKSGVLWARWRSSSESGPRNFCRRGRGIQTASDKEGLCAVQFCRTCPNSLKQPTNPVVECPANSLGLNIWTLIGNNGAKRNHGEGHAGSDSISCLLRKDVVSMSVVSIFPIRTGFDFDFA